MIYLVDDKISRQKDYGWNSEKLSLYRDILKPIYSYSEILDNNLSEQIFSDNSIVLFHESFFDSAVNPENTKDLIKIREKIELLSAKKENFKAAYFSGSKSSRNLSLNKKNAHIPVSILYQNLSVFIEKVMRGESDFRYLLFGENYKIEEILLNQLLLSNNNIDDLDYIPKTLNFIALTEINEIEEVFSNADHKTFYADEDNIVSDNYLNSKIEEWFLEKEYDNIFIPLCFGQTLSDFNGLRLATLIRCTKSISQLSNIFIYSFTGLEDFFENDYVNILKTKNVELVEYKKASFKEAVLRQRKQLKVDELPVELNKLDLKIPDNYDDNHSIANEYGIYQLAYNAGVDINEIKDFDSDKLESLYFKWLITKNGLHEEITEEQKEENKKYRVKLKGPTFVGYKIDLSKSR
jgi:hypothetical protein